MKKNSVFGFVCVFVGFIVAAIAIHNFCSFIEEEQWKSEMRRLLSEGDDP